MRIERGDPVSDLSAASARKLQRLLRIVDAAPDLGVIRSTPSLAGATFGEGECVIPAGTGFRITFFWKSNDAWSVAVEEA